VDHLDQRHQLTLGIGPVPQIGDEPLLHPLRNLGVSRHHRRQPSALVDRFVAGGHIDAGNTGQLTEEVAAIFDSTIDERGRRADDLGDLAHNLLAFSEDEGVDEVGQGFRVERAVASCDHER
jgi:hypothetical protein